MRIIGLTGGIACGKSNVSAALREAGAEIIDGDRLSRELTAPGGEALPALREAFGETVFTADGELNRKALGALVFGDRAALERLNGIMQPLIRGLIHRRLREAEERGEALCVLEMPLLYEEGLDSLCSQVWCVYLPEEEQIARLRERDSLTREEALRRIRSQMPAWQKAERADVVIDTSGSVQDTRAKIPALLAALAAEEGSGGKGHAAQ